MEGGDPLGRIELIAARDTLQSIRDRLLWTTAVLQRGSQGEDEARARRMLVHVQRHLWGLAGELVAVQERLLWVAEDLGRSSRAEELPEDDETGWAAELLSTIQCIIADSINPAIAGLTAACRQALRPGRTPKAPSE